MDKNFNPLKHYLSVFSGKHNIGHEIEDHVKEILGKYLPYTDYPNQDAPKCDPTDHQEADWNYNQDRNYKRYEVFDFHSFIVVKFQLSDKEDINDVIVKAGRVSIMVIVKDQTFSIPVPAHFSPKSAKAVYKDGVIEIRLQKIREEEYTLIKITNKESED